MKGFNNISEGAKSELKFSNKQFKEWLNNLDAEVENLSKNLKSRKLIAFILKIIVGVSGLVIASGFLKQLDVLIQIIGFVVLLIKLIEEILANLDRLLSIVAAKNAFNRVRREVVKIHTIRLGPILGIKDKDQEEAAHRIISLQSELIQKLIDIDNEIKTNLENKNHELLGRLTLEEKE